MQETKKVDGGYIVNPKALSEAYEKLMQKNPRLRQRYEYGKRFLNQPLAK